MATPEHGDHPVSSPLDAEREKLRKAGYNDTEISQILVARALGSSGPASDAPNSQGVLSGTVSSVVAIGSYARGTVFTIRHDLGTIFDATALPSARLGAAAMLVFKVAVISVLAYAGWQEWRQHIISETEIAAANAKKAHAEECSARAESAAKNMHMGDLLNGTYKGDEELARDCDPNYAHRKALEAACTEKFKAIFAPIEASITLDSVSKFDETFNERLSAYKSECKPTEADKEYGRQKMVAIQNFFGPAATTTGSRKDISEVSTPTPSAPTQEAAALPPPTPAPPSPPSNLIEAVVSDQLTLRTQPDKSAEAIVVLNKGAQVEVISTDANGWSQVQLSDQGTTYKGYVNGKYLTPFTIAFPTPVILTEPTDRDDVPSYCGHENAPMEFVICSNSALALQDSAMAKSYRILLARVSDPEALRSSQRQWNKDRRLNCNVASSGRPARQIPANMVQCVMAMTEARKLDLRAGRY